jgi:hypothetical protein
LGSSNYLIKLSNHQRPGTTQMAKDFEEVQLRL